MPYFSTFIDDTAQLNYPIQFDNDTEIYIKDKDQVGTASKHVPLLIVKVQ